MSFDAGKLHKGFPHVAGQVAADVLFAPPGGFSGCRRNPALLWIGPPATVGFAPLQNLGARFAVPFALGPRFHAQNGARVSQLERAGVSPAIRLKFRLWGGLPCELRFFAIFTCGIYLDTV